MILLNADTELFVEGLQDQQGNFVNDAIISGSVKKRSDSGTIASYSFTYVTASDGDYSASFLITDSASADCDKVEVIFSASNYNFSQRFNDTLTYDTV